ncbi:endoplasmic reticulum-plasma membrane tethering protein [Aureococcus anophagefferens]|uniref:Endoplasmic reticulum-plasma membrane tethering protein n=1 Tax=Aureococcus anophagefferens TaxID=44056 RepID=A0ABR1G0A6_AURAN
MARTSTHFESLQSTIRDATHSVDAHVIKPTEHRLHLVKQAAYSALGVVLRGGRSFRRVDVDAPAFRPPRPDDVAIIAQKAPRGEHRHYYASDAYGDRGRARAAYAALPPVEDRCERGTAAYALFTRPGPESKWSLEESAGTDVDVALLVRWVEVGTYAVFEAPLMRLVATAGGLFLRALLWLGYQRHQPQMRPHRGMRKGFLLVVNAVLDAAWPWLRALINTQIKVNVRSSVNHVIANLPKKPIASIFSLDFDIGEAPPQITSIALASSFSGYEYLDLDVGFVLHGDDVHLDAEIVVGGDDQPDVRATVSRFAIDGAPRGRKRAMQRRFNFSTLRLKLGPSIAPLPCVDAIRLGFTAKPTIKMDTHFHIHETVGIPVDVGVKALDRFLNRLVENVVDNFLCWPKHVVIPLASTLLGPDFEPDAGAAAPAPPIGTLHVKVTRCRDLINNDLVTGGQSDPYVIVSVGQREFRTPTIDDVADPVWASPEAWAFPVHESSQSVQLRVYDAEDDHFAFNDALLGVANVQIDELAAMIADARGSQLDRAAPRGTQIFNPTSIERGLKWSLDKALVDVHAGAAGSRKSKRRYSTSLIEHAVEVDLVLDTSVYNGKSKSVVLMSHRASKPSKVFIEAHFVRAAEAVADDARAKHRPGLAAVLARAGAYVAAATAAALRGRARASARAPARAAAAGAAAIWLAATALACLAALGALGYVETHHGTGAH